MQKSDESRTLLHEKLCIFNYFKKLLRDCLTITKISKTMIKTIAETVGLVNISKNV